MHLLVRALPRLATSPSLVILIALKSATADLHDRTEAAMPSLATLATVSGYTAALRALHGFHAEWEPVIWSFAELDTIGLDAVERRKLARLEQDLGALSATPLALPVTPARPSVRDASAALGALYVLEGATLGGRVVAREVAPALGMVFDRAGAYFRGYGERTGPMWTSFGTIITDYANRHHAHDEIVGGAVACFAALEQWLLTPGVLDSAERAVSPTDA